MAAGCVRGLGYESAVTRPMVVEKAFAMAQNLAVQRAVKTFTRLGGDFRACALDNRAFLRGLWKALDARP